MVEHFFIRIDGVVFCLTGDTLRFRCNWKHGYKGVRKKKCEECGTSLNLTFDHDPPLREVVHREHGRTLCMECHNERHHREAVEKKLPIINYNIKKCPKNHSTYFDFENSRIYCKICTYEKILKKIGEKEYER